MTWNSPRVLSTVAVVSEKEEPRILLAEGARCARNRVMIVVF